MQAVILAGGKGTRLKPYTAVFPKPLVPIGDKPIMEIVISRLRDSGFNDIIISTGHLAHLIEAYFGNGERFGVKIRYVREEMPLNTAGALKLIDGLDENFLVMNGDLLTDLNFKEMFDFHVKGEAIATIGVVHKDDKIEYGIIYFDGDGFLDYVEKPTRSYYISMGINILNRKAIDYIESGEAIGMPDLMKRLNSKGQIVHVFSSNCEWLDIGRPDDYEAAQRKMQ